MTKVSSRTVLRGWFGLAVCLCAAAGVASPPGGPTAEQARQRLLAGNQRYVNGTMKACGASGPATRGKLAGAQKPYAVVLACSDSRVPPEMVFDEGLGELFVVRVAGNVVDPVVLGSIEYAADHLGSALVVVLGHERCGAVTAAVDGPDHAPGKLAAIVKAISPAVERARAVAQGQSKDAIVEAAVVENARMVARDLPRKSSILERLVAEGKLRILAARYDLDDGAVTILDQRDSRASAGVPPTTVAP